MKYPIHTIWLENLREDEYTSLFWVGVGGWVKENKQKTHRGVFKIGKGLIGEKVGEF